MSTLLSRSQRVAKLQIEFRSSESNHRALASALPCPSAWLTCVNIDSLEITENQVLCQSLQWFRLAGNHSNCLSPCGK